VAVDAAEEVVEAEAIAVAVVEATAEEGTQAA
jgi:hypothetical protein